MQKIQKPNFYFQCRGNFHGERGRIPRETGQNSSKTWKNLCTVGTAGLKTILQDLHRILERLCQEPSQRSSKTLADIGAEA
ncbi:hypothetical protein B7992_04100 [Fibrobacter sp. UWH1]|nr:hypothetical protein B7992_04100 [Fibrobacter sp. UWH1]